MMCLEGLVNQHMPRLVQSLQVSTHFICHRILLSNISNEVNLWLIFVSASGFPRIEKLEIEGGGFHTNLYALRGNYFGGKEGKSKIQWLRSMVGSPDLISIPGTHKTWVISFMSNSKAFQFSVLLYPNTWRSFNHFSSRELINFC